jgi:nickel/cobalt transporter (NiCoT) family protein
VRLRGSLTPSEWRSLSLMGAVVVALHVAGFAILLAVVVPHHLRLGDGRAFSVGLGLTAYTFGLRHAFDADHISAIDNTTRRLMARRRRPLSTGFFFSLGHSSVVFGLALALALGLRGLSGPLRASHSPLHEVTAVVGTGISGGFLYLIGAINLVVLAGILRAVRGMRRDGLDEPALEARLAGRGVMSRLCGRLLSGVTAPWQMYPIGLLFGLGFDTATEVALLFLAAGAATAGLPFYAILCLPILFAAGMSLLDTIDGTFMNFAYGWAFSHPARRVLYNLTVTCLSVAVALIVGTIELLGLLGDELSLGGRFWHWVATIDLNALGLVIVATFALTWGVALLVWRVARLEERWAPVPSEPDRPLP